LFFALILLTHFLQIKSGQYLTLKVAIIADDIEVLGLLIELFNDGLDRD
jgi:hypothetical protein